MMVGLINDEHFLIHYLHVSNTEVSKEL